MKIVKYNNLLIVAASAMLVACASDNDTPSPIANGNDMSFNINVVDDADANSRAAGPNPESNIITHSNFADRSPFFRLMMAENDNGTWINYNDWVVNFDQLGWRTGKVKGDAQWSALNNCQYAKSDFYHHQYFWNKNTHHFYAIAGFANDYRGEGIPTLTGTGNGWCVVDFCNWCAHPQDLLWSFREELRTNPLDFEKPVPLTFYHSMAQLFFRFRNDNPNIKVEIYDVYVGNVYRCATLSLNGAMGIVMPDGKNWRDYVPTTEDYKRINEGNFGSMWFNHKMQAMHRSSGGMQYMCLDGYTQNFAFAQSAYGGNLTLLEIPQTIKRWNSWDASHTEVTKWDTSANFGFSGWDYRGKNDRPQYLVIKCKITDRNTGLVLWESANFDDENNGAHRDGNGYIRDYERLNGIIVPLTEGNNDTYTWLPGRSYTYNITFGNGAGWDSNGNPTLVPVNMYATIRGFDQVWQDIPASPGWW